MERRAKRALQAAISATSGITVHPRRWEEVLPAGSAFLVLTALRRDYQHVCHVPRELLVRIQEA